MNKNRMMTPMKKFALATGTVLGLAFTLPATAEEAKAAAALTTTAAPGTQALEIQLPKPLFVGTPKNIKSTNLEKPLPGKRPVYQVPAGTTLLSAGKQVTSSDQAPIIGSLEMVTDKDKEAERRQHRRTRRRASNMCRSIWGNRRNSPRWSSGITIRMRASIAMSSCRLRRIRISSWG